MRNQKDNHLRIEPRPNGWNAFLVSPEGEVTLLRSVDKLSLWDLIDDCTLNSNFDRDIETLL